MKFQRLFGILVLALPALSLHGQQNPIYIWNGFEQAWGYNHRCARLGDYVAPFQDAAGEGVEVVHTAASGSGADVADYRSYYAVVEGADIFSATGVERILLTGKEKEIKQFEKEVVVNVPGEFGGNYLGLLNGFDLVPAQGAKADKIMQFGLMVEAVNREQIAPKVHPPQGYRLKLRISGWFRMGCSSPECEVFNNEVRYELDVHWLALMGNGFSDHWDYAYTMDNWTRDSLPPRRSVDSLVQGKPGPTIAALGIDQIGLLLRGGEFHCADLDMHVRLQSIDPLGRAHTAIGLYFGQWKPGMYDAFRKYYSGKPKIPAKWAVKKQAGSATVEIGYRLLQFAQGTARQDSIAGQLKWLTRPGNQMDPRTESAVRRHRIDR